MMQAASGNTSVILMGELLEFPILPRTKKQPCFGCNILGKMKFKLIGQLLEEGLPTKQHILIQKLCVDAKADAYFTLMRDTGYLFAGAPPYPFHGAGRAAIDPFIFKALVVS